MGEMSGQLHPGTNLTLAVRHVLLVVLPALWLVVNLKVWRDSGQQIGFDFRGTLLEPARAVINGGPIFAEPTREGVAVGNPSVYPPLFILLATPFAHVPEEVASWLWIGALACLIVAAMRIVGVRDWRLHVLVVASPAVVPSLLFGNLTLALMVPLALAWRYRDVAWVVGTAVAVAFAAKLFTWPIVLWLLFTRRFKAAFLSLSLGLALVILPWALIGFEGFRDYPELLNQAQAVYASVSLSIASVAEGLGADTSLAVTITALAGLALVAASWWTAGRSDGDRRSYAAAIGACIVASPIVWLGYTALLFLPIAITWRRPSPAWFFTYCIWLSALLPMWGYPAGTMAVVAGMVITMIVRVRRDGSEWDGTQADHEFSDGLHSLMTPRPVSCLLSPTASAAEESA